MKFVKNNLAVLTSIILFTLGYDPLTLKFWLIIGSVGLIQLLFGWYD